VIKAKARAEAFFKRGQVWVERQSPGSAAGVSIDACRRYRAVDGPLQSALLSLYVLVAVLPALLVMGSTWTPIPTRWRAVSFITSISTPRPPASCTVCSMKGGHTNLALRCSRSRARCSSDWASDNGRPAADDRAVGGGVAGAHGKARGASRARLGCTSLISATIEEYETVRERPDQFLVLPDPVDPELERVVGKTDRFVVVEKLQSDDS
jgi:hypothetical protein